MPAVSKSQRRLFGYLAGNPKEAAKRGISEKTVEHFASTPETGLPERLHAHPSVSKHLKRGYHSNG